MGLFDELYIEATDRMPDFGFEIPESCIFQTHDLGEGMSIFVIKRDGRLAHRFRPEAPGGERDEVIEDFHGDIGFVFAGYGGGSGELPKDQYQKLGEAKFKARFTDGRLAWVNTVERFDPWSRQGY